MRVLRKLVCIVLWAIAIHTAAQEVPHIRHFMPPDYGGQNQNWSITQSAEGWIYAGNNSGLLEFDGSGFQLYNMPEKQTVRATAIGRDGMLFCGGVAEFGFWQPNQSGRLEYTPLSNGLPPEQLGKEEIWHILVMPDYVLFQSFSTIYIFDYQKVTMLRPPGSIMFARAINGRVLLPVIGRGLYELLPDFTFQFIESTTVLSSKFVQFLVSGPDGEIWAGTANDGIYVLRNGQCQPLDNPLNIEFKKYQLNKAIALKNGGWVIGTILNGAYILDAKTQLLFHINRENGLQNNTVLALFEDRDRNLWLGLDRGIDCIDLSSPVHIFDDQNGQIGTVYTAVEWNTNLFIGTNHGVFVRPSKGLKKTSASSQFHLTEGTQGQVWQLQVFDNQLICGHNSGTFTIANGIVHKISEVTGGWCTVRIPGHSDLLLQSTYTGLVVFNKNRSGQWQFSHRVNGFQEPLRKITFDTTGALWGAHPNKGLFRLYLNDDLTAITTIQSFTREDGLPTEFQLDLTCLTRRLLVNSAPVPVQINTDQKQSGWFTRLSPEFAGKKVLAGIGEDYFTIDSSGIRLIADRNAYYFPLTLVPAYENIVVLPSDKYLFCLENGFAVLERAKIASISKQDAPAAIIRCIATASGESFLPGAHGQFDWRQNSLKFSFAVPFYGRIPHFSWRLEGFSEQWSDWQNIPEKEFTNLPEGDYIFWVRTDLGGPDTQVKFSINAPWYRSRLAFLGYAALCVLLIAGVEKMNRMRLTRQRRHLEAEKERELIRQRTEGERELLLLEVDNKNRELSNAALNLIRKNEALQGLKDELLSLSKDTHALQKIIRHIDEHLEGDHDWEIFETSFNRVHDDFIKRLMHMFPDLTPGDLRLAAYLKMNLASKEIAPLFNISVRGVENKRYRLRKKLDLSEEANLTEFLLNF